MPREEGVQLDLVADGAVGARFGTSCSECCARDVGLRCRAKPNALEWLDSSGDSGYVAGAWCFRAVRWLGETGAFGPLARVPLIDPTDCSSNVPLRGGIVLVPVLFMLLIRRGTSSSMPLILSSPSALGEFATGACGCCGSRWSRCGLCVAGPKLAPQCVAAARRRLAHDPVSPFLVLMPGPAEAAGGDRRSELSVLLAGGPGSARWPRSSAQREPCRRVPDEQSERFGGLQNKPGTARLVRFGTALAAPC